MPIAVSHFIDVARWVAAFAVMLGHAAFISLPDIMTAPHGAGVYVWWFVTAFWHQAVIVFFVISGFLVGGKALRSSCGAEPFLRDYLIHRFSRIYIVFAPALALGVLVDTLGRHVFAGAGIYEWPAWDGVFAPSHAFAALFQLQSIWSGPVGTNGPLWSLACEFWYYIVFPLLLAPLSGAYSARLRIALFSGGLGLLIFLSIPQSFFLFGFGIWVLGALVALPPRPLIASKWLSLAIFLAAATAIRLAVRGPALAAHPYLQHVADATTAATFANLLLTLRFSSDGGFSFCRLAVNRRLSDFSYSLYATHGPIVILLLAASNTFFGKGWLDSSPTALHWTVQFTLIAALVATAYGFSTVTEAKTDALRRALQRFFSSRDRRAETTGQAGELDLERL
ncbi:MAG: acyltransferase [Methylocystaceae bacterium]|nr:MAG: acyltransferase [Methylocystaceae bacterium]